MRIKVMEFRHILDAIVIVLNSGHALISGHESLVVLLDICYLLFVFVIDRKLELEYRKSVFTLALIICMVLALVVNREFKGLLEYLRVALLFVMAYYMTTRYTNSEMMNGFCILMRIASIVSCVFFFIVSLFPTLSYPEAMNGNGVTYYTCFIANISKKGSVALLRNSGLFWEGGMYAALCALWQMIEISCRPKRKHFALIVLLGFITIYTTKSTTGYLYMIMLMLLLVVNTSNGKRSIWQDAIFMVGIVALIVLFFNIEKVLLLLGTQNRAVFGKIIEKNPSYTDRINNPVADLWTALHNPLGVGVGRLTDIVNLTSTELFGEPLTARTSTLTYYFAAFGIFAGLIVNVLWFRSIKRLATTFIERMVLTITFGMLCTSTPLNTNMIFIIILYMGLSVNSDRIISI